MKAVLAESGQPPVRFADAELPQAKANEILVRVVAAGVNPVDWKIIGGGQKPFPFVVGQDFAGVVSASGSSVTRYREGERVFGIAREHGSYAEYTVVPEDDSAQPVAKIPDDVGDADAAALPTPGLTALASVEWLNVGKASTLLILGASGGVGGLAVQMGKDRGARVIGTCAFANEAYVRSLGADDVAAYDRQDVVATLKARYPQGIEAILDLVDGRDAAAKTAELLAPGGKIVSTIGALDVNALQARGFTANNLVMGHTPQSSHAGLRSLAKMVEEGRLRVTIAGEEPLQEAARAIDASKRGSVNGKLILTV